MDRRSFIKGLLSSIAAAPNLAKGVVIEFPKSISPFYILSQQPLIRTQLWSKEIKRILLEELETMK